MIEGMLLWLSVLALSFAAEPKVVSVLDIAPVWSGHPVGFDLLTTSGRQFVAFYDDQRRMTVAARELNSDHWQFVRLPSVLGWDSHNSVTMAIDRQGYIHLTGNMHAAPLIYFRTAKPYDIDTFERVPQMTGANERRCTYPNFLRNAANELLFTYRDGSSGNGNQIYNIYDEKARIWRRLLPQPLTDGQGHRNAYFQGPTRGPDGYFHLCWVWRESPDCSTNHDLSYARSKDLVDWQTSAGKPLALPVTLQTAEIVNPVPIKGGIINGNTRIGFDSKKRPTISYHKLDQKGRTQIYNARLEQGAWKIYQTSDWDYRWDFQGGGSIQFEISVGSVRPGPGGKLRLDYKHIKYGSGTWLLDEETLKPVGQAPPQRSYPAELEKPVSSFPGMQVRFRGESGYVLRWETLGPNRDRPREPPGPSPACCACTGSNKVSLPRAKPGCRNCA